MTSRNVILLALLVIVGYFAWRAYQRYRALVAARAMPNPAGAAMSDMLSSMTFGAMGTPLSGVVTGAMGGSAPVDRP